MTARLHTPTVISLCAALITISACRRDPSADDSASDSGETTSDCFDLDLSLSEVIPTVVQVAFSADADTATIEFGLDGGLSRSVSATGLDGHFDQRVWGLKPDSTYTLRARVQTDEGTCLSSTSTLETGPVPAILPDLTVTNPEGLAAVGGFWLTTLVSTPSTPVIVDSDGDLVWWFTEDEDTESVVSRTIISQDHESILYLNFPTRTEDQYATHDLVRVSIDGTSLERTAIQGPHHDFTELPDGTIAIISYDSIEVDGERIDGDRIIELAPDGTTTTVWSIWDEISYDPDLGHELEGTGWAHANALDYDEPNDAYYLSLSNFESIYHIDRATGLADQRIGGSGSDYVNAADPDVSIFRRIHQFQFSDDGVIAFDNGMASDLSSQAIEYTLDADSGVATPVWSYHQDPTIFVGSLGDAFKLPTGQRVVVWSTAGQIDAVSDDGEVEWSINTGVGAGIGYTDWLSEL